MLWLGIYLMVAIAVMPMVFVAGQWFATGSSDSSAEHPAATAALAGMLWPVLILGLAELLLVSRTTHRIGDEAEPNRLMSER
jgi:ABC-type dipeptide/oligopeptide/nickel transport system permease component